MEAIATERQHFIKGVIHGNENRQLPVGKASTSLMMVNERLAVSLGDSYYTVADIAVENIRKRA